jgi:hypothetical protein
MREPGGFECDTYRPRRLHHLVQIGSVRVDHTRVLVIEVGISAIEVQFASTVRRGRG